MALQQRKRAVGTFSSREEAEAALNDLRSSGFNMDRVSILAKKSEHNDQIAGADVKDRGDDEAQEGAGIGAVAGTVLGGLGGLLVGLEALIIPGVGPFLAAGTIATTLAGAGIGAAAGSLVGALTGAGIPEEDARAYSDRISQGDYLVMIEGTEDEINRAGSILRNRNIRNWNIYGVSHEGQNYTSDVAPPIGRASDRYEDRTAPGYEERIATEDEPVTIVDKREQIH
ncbi:signal transduction histidine kinase LytS [Scytonema sp. UIC 10036]|uniref:general stress protein n=1 Tax=Scytonema sp. UIC 10036 TaxID=2304196 RepID=UPI0012DA05DF|nr:general stress protein [Scytonema sp. UIC 10036]MUG91446.1 signal transduction histidine kinase LytS [Scytonema sp. UIC 10036]